MRRHIDRIRDSGVNSRKRSFGWLWNRFGEYLDELKEDANQESVKKSLTTTTKPNNPKTGLQRLHHLSRNEILQQRQQGHRLRSQRQSHLHQRTQRVKVGIPKVKAKVITKPKAKMGKVRGVQRIPIPGAKLHASSSHKALAPEVIHAHFLTT